MTDTTTADHTDDDQQPTLIDTVIEIVIIIGVVAVAVVAAIVSYRHMQQLAHTFGEPTALSHLFPISVDGLIVVGSMVLVYRHRKHLKTSVEAWVAVILGSAASLAANAVGATPNPTAVLIAAWAPVSFGICFELLLIQLRSHRRSTTSVGTVTPAAASAPCPPKAASPVDTAPHALPPEAVVGAPLPTHQPPSQPTIPSQPMVVGDPVVPPGDPIPVVTPTHQPDPIPTTTVVPTPPTTQTTKPSHPPTTTQLDPKLVARARRLRDARKTKGQSTGRTVLERELPCDETTARKLVRVLNQPPHHHLSVVSAGGQR